MQSCGSVEVSHGKIRVRQYGTRSTTGFYETDEDLKETFLNAHRSAIQIIRDCEKICKELAKNGIRFYAGIFLPTLIDDSQNWEEEEISISE